MAYLRDPFVNVLKAQEGYHEGRDADGNWNNHQRFSAETPGLEWSQDQAWCATFTSWGATQTGMRDIWPITASCYTAVQWWKGQGRFTEYPVLGGPFYMGTSGQDHVGVVWKYDGDTIWTVEGNTSGSGSYQGDGVYLRQRPRRGPSSPYGYGVPAFSDGTVSADPNLGGIGEAEVGGNVTPNPPTPSRYVSLGHIKTAQRRDPSAPQGVAAYRADGLIVEKALNAEGLLSGQWVDGSMGTKTISAYAAWQRRCGYSGSGADGYAGIQSLQKLGDKYGFLVVD